jgi:N6-adenosine-specific RNA methylase IME4
MTERDRLSASLVACRPGDGAGAILADPPWRFAVRSPKGEGRSACQHYPTNLTLDELATLPVVGIAAADAWLFLWATTPMLPAALRLMTAWGFAYSGNAFCWVKQNRSGVGFHVGLGFTTRKNVELCLLGKRGRPRILAHDVRELIVAPRREHSRKPDEQYARIERLVAGPYVELFARQQWPGWIAWGNQTNAFDPPYDAKDDISKSVLEGFRAIRERVRSGGPGWPS